MSSRGVVLGVAVLAAALRLAPACSADAVPLPNAPGVPVNSAPNSDRALTSVLPHVAAVTVLSAQPALQSAGQGGPLNQLAIDVDNFGPKVTSIECVYPLANLRYRCAVDYPVAVLDPSRTRVRVMVPDLDKGRNVTLKLTNVAGTTDVPIELANPPQTIHEIVALPLPGGGQSIVGPNGKPLPAQNMLTFATQTTPAVALTMPFLREACGSHIYALWSSGSAASETDAVFTSAFGPLSGSVILQLPLLKNSPVRAGNGPQWLITFAASAQRVQFIAHYEVVYRVSVCRESVISN